MVDAPTDEQLLRDYAAGEIAGFELLVRRHTPELHQFVLRFTGDSVAAEDVVQETFLQVHHSAAGFDPQRRLKPWLFTIAANKARDHLRRMRRRREVALNTHIQPEEEGGRRFLDLMAGDETPPPEALLIEENRKLIRGIIETMPDKLMEVLILAYYHRFPYKEIAEIVGVPLGTVKSRLHAALAFFGQRYRETTAEQTRQEP